MNEQLGSYALRVGIFFDGTGHNQYNLQAGGAGDGESYRNARTNVAHLHALYPQGLVGDRAYCKRYVQGVGTRTGAADSAYAQATGRGTMGVEAQVSQALEWTLEQLDRQGKAVPIEVDLFGFSRGAAAARDLANRLDPGHCAINFIGLFDTVAAIIAPLRGDFDPADARHADLRLGLPAGIARQVVQLVAQDEQRHNFPLLRSGNDIVVPGAHGDVGGGYELSMREQVRLSKPYSSRVSQDTPVHRTPAYAQAAALRESLLAELGEPAPQVLSWEVPAGGGAQKQVYATAYREREVLGHLSRVYLSIMRELGVRGGVPFAALNAEQVQLPGELQVISGKLHEFALGPAAPLRLTAEEQALLRGKYVHTSANWNALRGLDSSALDFLYVNRPAEGGRVMHDNPLG